MFGFFADGFATQFSYLYTNYNGKPFNADDFYQIRAIQEIQKSVAAGYMKRTSALAPYVTQAQQAFHVLGLNWYCVTRNLLQVSEEIDRSASSFLMLVNLNNLESRKRTLGMLLPVAGMYARETFLLGKTYTALKREWTRFFNSAEKIAETLPEELIHLTEEEVPASSPTLDRMRYILLGLGRQQPLAILVHERKAIKYLTDRLGEGVTQTSLLDLFSEIMNHTKLISNSEFENFRDNHARYYSRLKDHRQAIEEMIQIEARQANYNLSQEELNRLTDSLIG